MVPTPHIAIVREESDVFASVLADTLRSGGFCIYDFRPNMLGDIATYLETNSFVLDGRPIAGIVFRVYPDSCFSSSFELADQPFCDVEIASTWLAAINLKSILAINRYDATAWFERFRWPLWRTRLMENDIAVSSFNFGNTDEQTPPRWYTYNSSPLEENPEFLPVQRMLGAAFSTSQPIHSYIMVNNNLIDGEVNSTILATIAALNRRGIRLAHIITDEHDAVLSVNTLPMITQVNYAEQVAHKIGELYGNHLSNW